MIGWEPLERQTSGSDQVTSEFCLCQYHRDFLQELIHEEYLYFTGALILYCCIFAKTAGYYFYWLVGYFGMDEGIATVLKVNSSKLLQVVDTLLFLQMKSEKRSCTILQPSK